MSTVRSRLLSHREYLAQERRADFRSEFYRGETFAMAGASWEHMLIKDNLAREAGNQLKNGPCYVLTSDLGVKVNATRLYTYPDTVSLIWQGEFVPSLASEPAVVHFGGIARQHYPTTTGADGREQLGVLTRAHLVDVNIVASPGFTEIRGVKVETGVRAVLLANHIHTVAVKNGDAL